MQDKDRRSNADRRAATRGALMKAARKLFVSKGYAETATPDIVKAADVTRGALYHHFKDKADLFRAVAELEAQAVATQISGDTSEVHNQIDGLLDGADAYFKAMAQPGRAQLLLIEAPVVLGHAGAQALSDMAGQSELRAGLAALSDTTKTPFDTDTMTHLLSAMFDRAALDIAEGAAPDLYIDTVRTLIEGLAA